MIHKILRKDEDEERLSEVRTGLTKLLKDMLVTDRLFKIFNSKDISGSENAAPDRIERRSKSDHSLGEQVMRQAIRNILSHKVDKFIKVDSIMHLLPLAVCVLFFASLNRRTVRQRALCLIGCGLRLQTIPAQGIQGVFCTAQKQVEITLRQEGKKLVDDEDPEKKEKSSGPPLGA